jgi:hypothetical protein
LKNKGRCFGEGENQGELFPGDVIRRAVPYNSTLLRPEMDALRDAIFVADDVRRSEPQKSGGIMFYELEGSQKMWFFEIFSSN